MAEASRDLTNLLSFAGTYKDGVFTANWGSDKALSELLGKLKDAKDITSSDMTQVVALSGKANVESQFIASVISEFVNLMKALLQKLS